MPRKAQEVTETVDGAEALRIRKELGLSQSEAGVFGGVSRYTVSQWEHGEAPAFYVSNLRNLLALRCLREQWERAGSVFEELVFDGLEEH